MMDPDLANQLTRKLEEYANSRSTNNPSHDDPKTGLPVKIPYGTAGFRGNASQIEHLFFNVGLISGFKCLLLKANVGVMITASHNPIQDNGIKLVGPKGEMLDSKWEEKVETFCNLTDTNEVFKSLEQMIESNRVSIKVDYRDAPWVIIGRDNRPSSEKLAGLVKQGLDAWKSYVEYFDFDLITTPHLHFIVAETNKFSFELITRPTYFQRLCDGYLNIIKQSSPNSLTRYKQNDLIVDCANGVGHETFRYMFTNFVEFARRMTIRLINIGEGVLNEHCGADYVKTTLLPPAGAILPGKRYASLDGDADRVVYFYLIKTDDELTLRLLDGDKILALFALYIREQLHLSGLVNSLSMGCIQTAYANGASTDYLTKSLSVQVDCVNTGVKNLHRQALKYDIGIYFEANGHGTIWLSDKAIESFKSVEPQYPGLSRILSILYNYTGDAFSDILIVEAILRHYDWDVQQWYKLYEDRPNVLRKLEIPDRSVIKTRNAGRTCIAPAGLQTSIDSIVTGFGPRSRAFVRASGTENVVRIYSEADSQESAEKIASKVAELVTQYCV